MASVRTFVCPTCMAAFVNRATLVRHTRVHTGHRPYRCTVCSRAFTQSGNLTRHVRAKHSPPGLHGNASSRSWRHHSITSCSWKITAKEAHNNDDCLWLLLGLSNITKLWLAVKADCTRPITEIFAFYQHLTDRQHQQWHIWAKIKNW